LLFLLTFFVFAVLWGLPKLSRWYFNTFQSDSTSQFVFVLSALFVSSLLAKWAGIEPIVGAFLSGLALNRVIPHHSPLMNRTVFIGNSLFIPFFLISVGMLVNLKILVSGFDTLFLAAVLITIAIAGKYFAAQITRMLFRYTKADGNLIFGLSASHAAATIAVILVGFELKILDEKVLNGTILLILATSMVSAFVTDYSGRIVAIEENDASNDFDHGPDRIILPVANPASFEKLFQVAMLTRQSETETIINPLFIISDGQDVKDSVMQVKTKMEQLVQHAAATDLAVTPITRVDINIPTGISRTVKELLATKIIMGWSTRHSTANYIFGNIIDNLLENTEQMVMVVRTNKLINLLDRIVVFVPQNADREVGFLGWVNVVIALAKRTNGKLVFLSNAVTLEILKKQLKEFKISGFSEYVVFEYYPNISRNPINLTEKDIAIAIAARPATISYSRRQLILPKLISLLPENYNFIIVYPEQVTKPLIAVSEINIDSFENV
jgi:hypothetical protein